MSKRSYPDSFESEMEDLEEESLSSPKKGRPGRSVRPDGDAGDDSELADVDALGEGSLLQGVLDNPEGGLEEEPDMEEELDDAVIEAAESMDLASFAQSRGKGYDDDAFEEWVKISRRHGNLKQSEIDALVTLAHGEDEEAAREAEDKLIRHNVKWIVRVLRSHPLIGTDIMDLPGGLRDDALSLGRMGFLMGIRKYDPERALKHGKAGHKKSLLKYGEYWIGKLAGEFMHQERFLLPEDASLDRKKVLSTQAILEKEWGRKPTDQEIADRLNADTRIRVAREDLRAELGRAPREEEIAARIADFGPKDERRLRRRGALLPDRIRELREHQTHRPSIDAPTQTDDEGPSLAEYVAGSEEEMDEMVANSEVYSEISALSRAAGDPKLEFLSRVFHSMPTEDGGGLHFSYSKEEMGNMLGRSRGSIETYETEHRRRMMGEMEVPAEQLSRSGYGFHVQAIRKLVESLGKGADENTTAALEEAKEKIREVSYLPELLLREGVARDLKALREGVACPLSSHEPNEVSFRADAERFSCTSCGVEGDLFDWLRLRRGLDAGQAVIEAARLAIGVPEALVQGSGNLLVSRSPQRRERVRRLG